MLTRRIIPCLDVDRGRVVKGVHFAGLRDAGDPQELGAAYARAGADELIFLDISATRERRGIIADLAARVAEGLFIPFTVGGGLRDVDSMRDILRAGADKIVLNTAAVEDPRLLREAADRFGSQAVVLAIDAARANDGWRVYVRAGSEATRLDPVAWAVEAVRQGAGEILLTSIDRDGTRSGFDIDLLRRVAAAVPVPVIASGGAGALDDLHAALDSGGADAVLAASVFHFNELSIAQVKSYLASRGVPVRKVA